MRLPALLVGLACAAASVAGCGGAGAPTDPGRAVAGQLVDAASGHDAQALWDLLSTGARRLEGGDEQTFARRGASALERRLAPFARRFDVVVSERITDDVGVVAIRNGADAYAVPLRRERGEWKAEVASPVRIAILGPRPGSAQVVGQIGVEVHARGGVGNALLYLDGQSLEPNVYPGRLGATVFANLPRPAKPGRHVAVAYADLGAAAAAVAWTFDATGA